MKIIVIHYYHLLNIALMVKAFLDDGGVPTKLLVHENLVKILNELNITDYDVLGNFEKYVDFADEIICHHHEGAMRIVNCWYGTTRSKSRKTSSSTLISFFADGFRNSLLSVQERGILVNGLDRRILPGRVFVFGYINEEHKIKVNPYLPVVIPYRFFFIGLKIGNFKIDSNFIKCADNFSERLVVALRPWGSKKYMNGKYAHPHAGERLYRVLVSLIDNVVPSDERAIIFFKGDSRDAELSLEVFSMLRVHYAKYTLIKLDDLMCSRVNFDMLLVYILDCLCKVKVITLDSSIPVPFVGERMGEFLIGAPIEYLEAAQYSHDFMSYFALNIKALERDIDATSPGLYSRQKDCFLVPRLA